MLQQNQKPLIIIFIESMNRPNSSILRNSFTKETARNNNPRPTTGFQYQSSLVKDYQTLRDSVQEIEQRNRQFIQSIRMNELVNTTPVTRSRSNRKNSNDTLRESYQRKFGLSQKMEIQRLNNKIQQQIKAKNLLEQQIQLIESRCKRQTSKVQRIQDQFRTKLASVKLNLSEQIEAFSDKIIKDIFLKIQRKNNRNKQLLERISIQLKYKNNRSKSRSKRSIDHPFKKKDPDDQTKHMEEIGQKYQKLFENKNSQLQTLQQMVKKKDKQIHQLKITIDKLHSQQKEQLIKSSSLIHSLEQKISQLAAKQQTPKLLRKDSNNRSKQISQQTQINNLRNQLKQKISSLLESNTKITSLERLSQERASTIQTLQQSLNAQKTNKSQLWNQYQASIQRNKNHYKIKLQHVLSQSEELKSSIIRKDEFLKQTKQRENQLLDKIAELDTDILGLNQKLHLRQELFLQSTFNKQDSLLKSADSSIVGFNFQQEELQILRKEKRVLLVQKEELKIEIGTIEDAKKRLQEQMRISQMKIQQLEEENSSLKIQIIQLQKSLLVATREQSLIQQPIIKTSQQLQLQIKILQCNNQLLQKQNIHINSELVKLQHDLKLSTDLHNMLESKILTFKSIIQENQKKDLRQQQNIVSLNRIISLHKEQLDELKYQWGFKHQNLKEELLVKAIQIDKLNMQMMGTLTLQSQLDEAQNFKAKLQIKNNHLQEQINSLQEDIQKQRQIFESEIDKLKLKSEQLTIKNIQNQETIKFQLAKINQIEKVMFSKSQQTQIPEPINKIKQLEQTILELQISKSTLHKQFQQSEKLRENLKEEKNRISQQIKSIKQQFKNLLFKNDQKIQEQDQIIKALELTLKQKEKQFESNGSRRGVDRSESNSTFLSIAQFDLSQEQNIDFFDKLPSAIDKLQLKRKGHIKMMQKVTEYIKLLKVQIMTQQKTIKLLHRRIQAFKEGNFSDKLVLQDLEIQAEQQLRKFQVASQKQVNVKRKHTRRIRALQHQKQLILQENTILQRQINTLQDQLLRADDEERNYVKMKEIYKEEIGRQRKTIIERDQQIKKLSQLQMQPPNQVLPLVNNNMEDAAQVFIKIMTIILNTQRVSFSRKLELEEYIKVISCILHLQMSISNWMIQEVRK